MGCCGSGVSLFVTANFSNFPFSRCSEHIFPGLKHEDPIVKLLMLIRRILNEKITIGPYIWPFCHEGTHLRYESEISNGNQVK